MHSDLYFSPLSSAGSDLDHGPDFGYTTDKVPKPQQVTMMEVDPIIERSMCHILYDACLLIWPEGSPVRLLPPPSTRPGPYQSQWTQQASSKCNVTEQDLPAVHLTLISINDPDHNVFQEASTINQLW
jgi:hypothetical protein